MHLLPTSRTLARLAFALALCLPLLLAAGCTAQQQADVPEPTEPTASLEPTEPAEPAEMMPARLGPARYKLVFDATWSKATHPTDFPSGPHFSGLIGAAHGSDAVIWEEGELASPGIKNMAETGGKSPLDDEVEALIAKGDACSVISGGGVGTSPGKVSVEFSVNNTCPLVSVVTMVAPSPDWFVGVSGLDLRENGEWAEKVVVKLYPWDAGTDSGRSYASGDAVTDPAEKIFEMPSAPPIEVDGKIPPFGTFTFTKVAG